MVVIILRAAMGRQQGFLSALAARPSTAPGMKKIGIRRHEILAHNVRISW
jgi:hypothetical protein